MNATLKTLRSAGILIGIWAIAAAIAWIAGVLPPFGAAPADATSAHEEEEGSDEGAPDGGAVAELEADAGTPSTPPPEPSDDGSGAEGEDEEYTGAPTRRASSLAVCADADAPTVAIMQVVGDARPELILGCGGRFDVFGSSSAGKLLRVATFTSPPAPLGEVRAGRAAAGDVNGDSRPDLLLPFVHRQGNGANVGGSLHIAPQSSIGAFDSPIALGNPAVTVAFLDQLDGERGFDIVALNQANRLARRPSEAWVFTGGPAPTRAGVHTSGVGGSNLTLADLDRDGELDIVVAVEEQGRLDVFFGDGTGHFPRTAPVTAEGVDALASGDLDGDGGTDVLITGTSVQLLRAGPAESLTARPVELPAGLRSARLYDVDGDGKRDVVGLEGGRLRYWAQGPSLSFEARALLEAGGLIPTAYAVGDLDGDGRLDCVAIDGRESPVLAVVSDVLAGPVEVGAPQPPTDAPLVLRVPLE